MRTRRLALVLTFVALAVVSGVSFAQSTKGNDANNTAQSRKLSKEEQTEIALVRTSADAAASTQAMPNDLAATWAQNDVLKAPQGNKQYVPFTVSIDPAKVTGGKLMFYWRVVSNAEPVAAVDPAAKPAKADDKKKPVEYAYEDFATVTIPDGQTAPYRISRSFVVPPQSYSVYVVMKEPAPEKKNAPAAKVAVLKQAVEIPDFWTEELNTSTVILADKIEPLAAPLTPQQQSERPYAFGSIEIVPTYNNKFSKKGELSTFMLIYNAKADAQNKPDVSVEYNFYTKSGGAEKFFNKTNPQSLNAQTLPAQFDATQGHLLQSGQSVPLASFPEGDYRLEIKVTDKLGNKTLTRNVEFSISGS
jgi:hypothetical protein